MAGSIIDAMDQRPEPEQPPKPRRARPKPAPDAPELTVVASDDAPTPAPKRTRRAARTVLSRADIVDFFQTQPIAGTELSVREHNVKLHVLLVGA